MKPMTTLCKILWWPCIYSVLDWSRKTNWCLMRSLKRWSCWRRKSLKCFPCNWKSRWIGNWKRNEKLITCERLTGSLAYVTFYSDDLLLTCFVSWFINIHVSGNRNLANNFIHCAVSCLLLHLMWPTIGRD